MRGLLEKDMRLLRTRKKGILIFLAMMVLLGISNGGTFVIGYGTMLFGILAVSTISYDEFDNGMPFIMTLPITGKDYVREKYAFCGGLVLIGWIASVLIGVIMGMIHGELPELMQEWPEMISLFPLFWMLVSVLVVLELKYGVEKSRTVMMVLAGGVFALGMIGSDMFSKELPTIFVAINRIPDLGILLGITGISALVIAATYVLSCKVMENKQY